MLRYNSADAHISQFEFGLYNDSYWAHDYSRLAAGWSFVAPNIFDVTESESFFGERIRLADGSTYTLSPTYELKGYELNDITLTYESGEYILTYSSGIKEHFDNTYGTLIKREDRFGNEITYEYETVTVIAGRKMHIPKKITDSVGNVINISNDFSTFNGKEHISEMTFSINNTVYSTINFNLFTCGTIVVDTIESIEDAEGNITIFEYIDI